ncbi:putative DNA repair ATPase [Faustovirus]|nr:putative DNA repair ATPase [Faustovirus]QJX74045.1 hypothetical protein F-E9_291 [Faustovirus]
MFVANRVMTSQNAILTILSYDFAKYDFVTNRVITAVKQFQFSMQKIYYYTKTCY